MMVVVAPVRAGAEENGLKIGDGRLHPYFDLEGRYDSAAQINVVNGSASGLGDFILHFRPGFKLDVPSPTFAVTLSADGDYLVYTGLNSSNASQLNRLQAEADLDLGIFRGSVVGLDIGDHFTRSDQTTNVGLPYGVLSLFNDARAAVTIAPGGGSLTISPGYHFLVETFQALANVTAAGTPTVDFGNLNYTQHRITLENRWRFLPKTAVLLDGEYDIRNYGSTAPATAGETPNQNISYFKASTGLTGLITPHFSTVLKLGWAMDLTAGSFSSLIAQAEGTYIASETSQLRLGFLRNFEPVSSPYVSYEDDRGYLQGRVTFFGRLTLNGYAAVDYLGFRQGDNATPGSQPRNDLLFTISAGADFEVTRWFILGAGDQFTTRSTDQPTADIQFAGLNLTEDQVYLRLTFTY